MVAIPGPTAPLGTVTAVVAGPAIVAPPPPAAAVAPAPALPPLAPASQPALPPPLPTIPRLTKAAVLDSTSPDFVPYCVGHTARTDAAVQQVPFFGAVKDRLKAIAPTSAPVRHDLNGRELFVSKGSLTLAGAAGTPDRVLVDVKSLPPDTAISGFSVSPDGSKLAYGTALRGDDWQTWSVIDVDTGAVLMKKPIFTKHFVGGGPQFSADGKSILYPDRLTRERDDKGELQIRIKRHTLGTSHRHDTTVFADGQKPESERQYLVTELAPGEVLAVRQQATAEVPLIAKLLTTNSDGATTRVDLVKPGAHYGRLVVADENTAFFRTSELGNGYGVMAVDLKTLAKTTIVPEEPGMVLTQAQPLGKYLMLQYLTADQQPFLRIVDRTGVVQKKIVMTDFGLPKHGGLTTPTGNPGSKRAWFTFSAVNAAPETFVVDTQTLDVKKLDRAKSGLDGNTYQATFALLRSDDGTADIPVYVYARSDLAPGARLPLSVVLAYGNIGAALPSHFNPQLALLVDAGATVAIAGIRGGGEFGLAHQRAGEDPRASIADQETVGRWMKAQAADPSSEKALLIGRSYGGMKTLANLCQVKDSAFDFRVAVAPVTSPLRWLEHGSGGWAWDDFFVGTTPDGTAAPATPAILENLRYLDSLKNIRQVKTPPRFLYLAGGTDDWRVDPWAAPAMMHAVEQQFGRRPGVYLKVYKGGHEARAEAVDVTTLMLAQLGAKAFPAASATPAPAAPTP